MKATVLNPSKRDRMAYVRSFKKTRKVYKKKKTAKKINPSKNLIGVREHAKKMLFELKHESLKVKGKPMTIVISLMDIKAIEYLQKFL